MVFFWGLKGWDQVGQMTALGFQVLYGQHLPLLEKSTVICENSVVSMDTGTV